MILYFLLLININAFSHFTEAAVKKEEIVCPDHPIHATNLLCHGIWNCNEGYHCKHHPCFSNKVCTNKNYKVQECPIIQEICDDPLVLLELKEFICEASSQCNQSNSYIEVNNERNTKFKCCPHECLPRHKICRQIEHVYKHPEAADVMEVSMRNDGNAAVNRALVMNLVFMVIAGLVYMWLYFKK